ncbi:MAG: hypothetical protein MJY42_01410 [Bacteroidales bacterium]|nr:hypothetical protein [Bacteroidales bacterium]
MKFEKKMLSVFLVGIAALIMAVSVDAANPKRNAKEKFQYDLEYVKTSGDGVATVKVWSCAPTWKKAQALCRRDAVHGVIFKGYSGQGAYQAPLVRSASAYEDNADFFDAFFDNGDYERYISNVVDGSQEARQIKGGFKVAQVVNVNVKMLRKHLEEAGIAKGLSSGF